MSKLNVNDFIFNLSQWLKLNGAHYDYGYLQTEIGTHPNYPSLVSLTDFLDVNGLSYDAVAASADYIQELNYPLLAHLKLDNGMETTAVIPEVEYWKKNPDVKKSWTGITIMPQKDIKWDIKNSGNHTAAWLGKAASPLAVLVLLLITIYPVFIHHSYTVLIFSLLSVLGIFIAWLTFNTEVGVKNSLVKQVCGMAGKGGCEAVMKSKSAKGFLGISPADAGITWFVTQWLLLLLALYIPDIHVPVFSIITISITGIAISAWSLYPQYFITRKWCPLCLALVSVLLLQSVLAVVAFPIFLSIKGMAVFAVVFFLILLVLTIPIKNILRKNVLLPQVQTQLKRWQSDVNVFLMLLKNEPVVGTPLLKSEFQIGNENSPVQIVVACNPYCGPCAGAHEKLDLLLHHYKDKISMKVRFSIDAKNKEDKRTQAVALLLQANQQKIAPTEDLLADWFKWMDKDKWAQKYKVNPAMDVTAMLAEQDAWSRSVNITYTPTIFINGHRLPGQYSMDNLIAIMPNLIEEPE